MAGVLLEDERQRRDALLAALQQLPNTLQVVNKRKGMAAGSPISPQGLCNQWQFQPQLL